MVRTSYILGGLALVLAGALFVLCVTSGMREDSHADGMTTLSAVERFKQSGGGRKKPNRDQTSPLIRQAQLLAHYLDPPVPPKQRSSPAVSKAQNVVAQTPEVRPANTSPKFELHGISYRPSRPEDSMALVWQADTGHHWVRQGATLGHIVIESIKPEAIEYQANRQTLTMLVDLESPAPESGQFGPVKLASQRKRKQKVRGPVAVNLALSQSSDKSLLRSSAPKPPKGSRPPMRRYRLGR